MYIYIYFLLPVVALLLDALMQFFSFSQQAAIRKELNEFKSTEMEVHASSKHLTRSAFGNACLCLEEHACMGWCSILSCSSLNLALLEHREVHAGAKDRWECFYNGEGEVVLQRVLTTRQQSMMKGHRVLGLIVFEKHETSWVVTVT